MAFAHHHAAQYDQGGGGETELFGSQQGHQDDVAPGLQLSVGLQPDLPAKVIHDQCLLRLRQSQFGRQSGRSGWSSSEKHLFPLRLPI